jgi:DNA-binding LacI/PurR family transcriptional regulator/serine phosphatase RsbU (regulator of sigma subunit)
LALLVDSVRDSYQSTVLHAIADAAEDSDVNVVCMTGGILGTADPRWQRRNVLYDLVDARTVDGVIISAGTMAVEIGRARLAHYVEHYAPLPLVCMAYHLDGHPSVLVDNERGMREVIEHLVVHHGRRRIAFVRGPAGNEEAEKRYAAYRRVLCERGIAIDPNLVFQGDFTRESGWAAAERLMDCGQPIDGVAAANDLMALGIIEALNARGVHLPEKLAIVGFDDTEDARFSAPQLTTVRQPFRTLGRTAVQLALAQIDGHPVPPLLTLVPPLAIRRSCGCSLEDLDRPPSARLHAVTSATPASEVRRQFQVGLDNLTENGIKFDQPTALDLFDRLVSELYHDVNGAFTRALDALIRTRRRVDLASWTSVLDVMIRTVRPWTAAEPARRAVAERVEAQIRRLVGDTAELAQGQLRLEATRQMRALGESGEALAAAFDLDTIQSVLRRVAPAVGIDGFVLVLYEDQHDPLGHAHVQSAWHVQRGEFAAGEGTRFESRGLAPPGLLFGAERVTYVIEPLFFEKQHFGFVIFVASVRTTLIYEALRDQVSGALKAGALMAQVINESRYRQLAEKERAEREIKIAERIQTMLLPKDIVVAGLEVAAVMIPAVNVGGDYYDILPVAGGAWLGIGDVTGHGLAAGPVMMMLHSMVGALVCHAPEASPAELMTTINSAVHQNLRTRLEQEDHVTFSLLRWRATGQLVYAGAHEPMLIWRARSRRCEQIELKGVWLGILPDIRRETADAVLQLDEGDILLLHTDGVTEAHDAGGRMFGVERLSDELQRVHERSAAEICAHIVACVKSWMAVQSDDLSLVVARRASPAADGSPSSEIVARLP